MSNKNNTTYLPDAELDIMRELWRSDRPLCISELVRLLADKRGWTRATVHVLISRLDEKGFIDTDKSERVFRYGAKLGEEEYKQGESRSFLQRIYDGSAKSMVASLIDTGELNGDDIAELAEFLNGKRGEK